MFRRNIVDHLRHYKQLSLKFNVVSEEGFSATGYVILETSGRSIHRKS
jgi:hypothetical protein